MVSTSCPPGYVLSAAPLQGNMYTTCECDYQNPNILDCNGHSITLRVSRLHLMLALSSATDTYIISQLFRKVCGLHRKTTPKSLCLTRVHPNTVSVHLGSKEGLQLAASPLIARTVTASAAVTEKVSHAYV